MRDFQFSIPRMKVVATGTLRFTDMDFIEYNVLTAAAVISMPSSYGRPTCTRLNGAPSRGADAAEACEKIA